MTRSANRDLVRLLAATSAIGVGTVVYWVYIGIVALIGLFG